MQRLPEAERSVLRMRFGLDDGLPKSASEISAVKSVSKEKVRLLEYRALGKLRSLSAQLRLQDYLRYISAIDEPEESAYSLFPLFLQDFFLSPRIEKVDVSESVL